RWGDRGCYYRDYYYRDYYSGVRGLSIGAARARTNVATAAVTCLRTLPWNDRVTKLPHGWRACSAPYAQPSGWAWWSLLAAWRPPRLPPPRCPARPCSRTPGPLQDWLSPRTWGEAATAP